MNQPVEEKGTRAGPAAALVFLLTFLSYPLGLAVGNRFLLPLLNSVPAWVLMAWLLERRQRRAAVFSMLGWALCLAVSGTFFLRVWPSPPDGIVLHGPAYRDAMFHWIRTGEGSEGHLKSFLPEHLRDLAVFVGLSLATASLASITLGAVLMNYMSFYVASLSRSGVPLASVLLFGWQPYALCRVAAFSILGAVLCEPLWSRLRRYEYAGLRSARTYLLGAGGLLLADWTLKTLLAPIWRSQILPLLP